MSNAEDRNKALVNFNRSLGANLDKEIAKQKSDLQQGSRVKYSAQFRSELSEAKSCEERGNWTRPDAEANSSPSREAIKPARAR